MTEWSTSNVKEGRDKKLKRTAIDVILTKYYDDGFGVEFITL